MSRLKIGLWSDAVKFPSIPLMKISAYHKTRGDTVKIIDNLSEHFDVAYCSKTFNLPNIKNIPQLPQLPSADKIVLGGTGFSIEHSGGKEQYHKNKDQSLEYDIEHMYPDYELYPEFTSNTSFGFLTRGCPNCCEFCVVGGKEGVRSVHSADLNEFWSGQKNITIMDANLLACDKAEELIVSLIQTGAFIDFTQGLDARYIDDNIARLLCRIKIKMAHFAFDLMSNETQIIRGLKIFRKYFRKSDRQCKVYILTNYNTSNAEDWYRVKKVIELGFRPDVRIYRKGTHNQFLTDLARWANNSRIYRSCSFEDYVPRKNGITCGELYKSVYKTM